MGFDSAFKGLTAYVMSLQSVTAEFAAGLDSG